MNDPVFPADAVVTFTAPKPAHVFGQMTRRWDQPVVVAPIGSPDEAIVSELDLRWAGAAQSLVHRPRAADANKGKFGHVLVVGGSFGSAGGKAGAPAMTSLAALARGRGAGDGGGAGARAGSCVRACAGADDVAAARRTRPGRHRRDNLDAGLTGSDDEGHDGAGDRPRAGAE